jgi:hypothetical protein
LRKLHFILDYETIGQDVFKAPVVNCAYYLFDWERLTSDNPYTFQELIAEIRQDKFKIREQIEDGGYARIRRKTSIHDVAADILRIQKIERAIHL